ncbi:MAG: thioredoxin fold domain-containing protein [Chthonomonadetes bacterium]|nr:thioredoxin fold domain-containing protein [Chthonomonadetes bacterium]
MQKLGFWLPIVILLGVAGIFWSAREVMPLEVVRVLMTVSLGVAGVLLLRRRGVTATLGIVFIIGALWVSQPGVVAGRGEVNMLPASKSAIQQAVEEGKPVILVFTADWCPFCRRLERETFTDGEVARLAKQFAVFRVDMTSSNLPPETAELAKQYGAEGLPTVAFLNGQGEWLKSLTLVGYEPPREFAQRLRRVLQP